MMRKPISATAEDSTINSSLFTSLKDLKSSLSSLVSAHTEYTTWQLQKAVEQLGKAVLVLCILGPLITVCLGLIAATVTLYFGLPELRSQDNNLFVGLIAASCCTFGLALVAGLYVKNSFVQTLSRVKHAGSEVRSDLQNFGGTNGRQSERN